MTTDTKPSQKTSPFTPKQEHLSAAAQQLKLTNSGESILKGTSCDGLGDVPAYIDPRYWNKESDGATKHPKLKAPKTLDAPSKTTEDSAQLIEDQALFANNGDNVLKCTSHDGSGDVSICTNLKEWLSHPYTGPTRPLRQKKSNMETMLEARPHILN
jgi:hypothetical protein